MRRFEPLDKEIRKRKLIEDYSEIGNGAFSSRDDEYTRSPGYELPSKFAVGGGTASQIAHEYGKTSSSQKLYAPGAGYRGIAKPGGNIDAMKQKAVQKMLESDARKTLAFALAAYAGTKHPLATDPVGLGSAVANAGFKSYDALMSRLGKPGRRRRR